MSRKVVALLAIAILAIAIATITIPPAAAQPITVRHWYITLVDRDGKPLANEEVWIIVYNVTGNCKIAEVKDTTDDTGTIELNLYKWYSEVDEITINSGTYNVTILIEKYGKWFLLNWTKDIGGAIDVATLEANYINATVVCGHWWRLNFTALTNIQDPTVFNITLFYKDPERKVADKVYFRIKWDESDEVIWERAAFGGEEFAPDNYKLSTAERLFNISDTWVEVYYSVENCPLVKAHNVTLTKEVIWSLNKENGFLNVTVSKESLEFKYPIGDVKNIHLNVTDLIGEKWTEYNLSHYAQYDPGNDGAAVFSLVDTIADLTPEGVVGSTWTIDENKWFSDKAYTVLMYVDIRDICGNDISWADEPQLAVTIEWEHEGKAYILRSGLATVDLLAPSKGLPVGNMHVFWLPDIERLYGENLTLRIDAYTIMVFYATFNTTDIMVNGPIDYIDSIGKYGEAGLYLISIDATHGYSAIGFTAYASLVEAKVAIKDKQPTAQPLAGAIVVIEGPQMDPINTFTEAIIVGGEEEAYVHLPPYVALGGGSTVGGEPIFVRRNPYFYDLGGAGYLPVPFNLKDTGETFTYRFKIWWKLKNVGTIEGGWEAPWVEVTPEDNELVINLTDYRITNCETREPVKKVIFAEVYELKLRVIDLCGRPLTPDDDPNIMAILEYTIADKTILIPAAGIDAAGTLVLKQVPGGEVKIKLVFRGMLLEPVNETKTVKIDGNIWEAVTFQFPVGDFVAYLYQWDIKEPLTNLTVRLIVYKNGEKVFTIKPNYTDPDKEIVKDAEGRPFHDTDCEGKVVFTKVPLKPAEQAKTYGFEYDIRIVAWTNEYTPYIRPQDAGLVVLNESIVDLLEVKCDNSAEFPTWIYSFKVIVTDHTGENVLKTFKTDIADYPVIFAIVDDTYGLEWPLWVYCGQYPCYCWENITVDFRIINATAGGKDKLKDIDYDEKLEALRYGMLAESEEAIFRVSSSQLHDPNEFGFYPHLFVAGAEYTLVVWHGGVLVYNYTIELPKPDKTITVFFDECDKKSYVLEGAFTNYTWFAKCSEGHVKHPIAIFTPGKSWKEGGERYESELKLVTWVQTLEVYVLSNNAEDDDLVYAIPNVNLTLVRNDVINFTTFATAATFAKFYYNITDVAPPFVWAKSYPTQPGNITSYAWNAIADSEGKVVIQVPVWLPIRADTAWTETLWAPAIPQRWIDIKFGANIIEVFLLAGSEWGTPSVPDTPHNSAFDEWIGNSYGEQIWHYIYGYVINWNATTEEVEWLPTNNDGERTFYAKWVKDGVAFYGNNTAFTGDWWNMTYWSGATKVVRTLAMDQFCVVIRAPDRFLKLKPLAGQYVNVTPIGATDEEGEEWKSAEKTDSEGKVVLRPKAGATVSVPVDGEALKEGVEVKVATAEVAYKFDVDYAHTLSANAKSMKYKLETWINYADLLKPYAEVAGKTAEEFEKEVIPVSDWRVLYTYVNFTVDHETLDKCEELVWDALIFTVEDWSGRPLTNMLATLWPKYLTTNVGATKTYASAIAYPAALGFTGEDGIVILYVPPTVSVYDEIDMKTYEGVPAFELKVYWIDTYLLWKAGALKKYYDIYASSADPTYGERYYVPGEGTTIQCYVYTGTFRIVGKDGMDLPPELLERIKVYISWPDGAITEHKPASDGSIKMIMNGERIKDVDKERVVKAPDKVLAIRKARNPESPVPQAPHGDYVVTITIDGKVVATKPLRIHKARQDFPELVVEPNQIMLYVAKDVKIKLTTPFGTPMAGAEVELSGDAVEIVKTAGKYTANTEGVVVVPYVLLGYMEGEKFTPAKITVTVKSWKSMPIDYSEEKDAAEEIDIVVKDIGKIVVKVVGSRGQGIAGADVTISGPVTIKGATDASGVFAAEVVEDSWTVTVEKGGKKASTSATVTGGKETTVELKLDIFMTIAGWEVSMSEFTGLLLLIIILIIVVFIIAHEYSVWRKKRYAAAFAKAKPE